MRFQAPSGFLADPFSIALASAEILYATISKAKEMWDASKWNRQVAKDLILFIQDLECNNEELQRITKERRARAFHRSDSTVSSIMGRFCLIVVYR